MIDFVFRNQTDIIYGKGEEVQVGRLIREFGGSRVLVHHSGEPFVKPLIERVRGYLAAAGLHVVELDGVVPNPRLSKVYEGINLARAEKVDFLLAVGGGSVIDSAKAIATGVPYDGDVWDFFDLKGKPQEALPIGVISTFAGTGSETTCGTVVTKEEIRLKRGMEDAADKVLLRPRFVILQPELTFTIPRYQTACGIADIISHMTENFFSPDPDNDFSDQFLSVGLKTAVKYGPLVLDAPDDYEARGALMLLSCYAICGHMKVGRRGDWSCHSMEHEMSGEWDIAHGAGLAILTPRWMKRIYKEHRPLFLKYAINVFGIPYDADNPDRTILAGIDALTDFFYNRLGLPNSLEALGILPENMTDDIMLEVAKNVFYYGQKTIGRLHPLDFDAVVEILKSCRTAS